MAVPTPGRIFVSYRRRETRSAAGRLTDRLIARFGAEQVFIDVDSIQLRVDFRVVIQRAVAACEVLLAVIGPHWLTTTDQDRRRRLDDPEDVVRLEIEAALKRDIRVVPVLVEGAVMPRRPDLPESLAALASRNALTVRHESFGDDVGRLIEELEQVLDAPATVPESSVSPAGTRARGRAAVAQAVQTPSPPPPLSLEELAIDPPAVLLVHHAADVSGVAFSPDGRLLATASDDHTARVWEAATGQQRTQVTVDNEIWGVAFSPDGRLLATACKDGTARVWSLFQTRE